MPLGLCEREPIHDNAAAHFGRRHIQLRMCSAVSSTGVEALLVFSGRKWEPTAQA
jgi:hypothetical protein